MGAGTFALLPGASIGPPIQQARTQSEASATRKEIVMTGAFSRCSRGRWCRLPWCVCSNARLVLLNKEFGQQEDFHHRATNEKTCLSPSWNCSSWCFYFFSWSDWVVGGLMLGYCSTASGERRGCCLAWSAPFLGAIDGGDKLGH